MRVGLMGKALSLLILMRLRPVGAEARSACELAHLISYKWLRKRLIFSLNAEHLFSELRQR